MLSIPHLILIFLVALIVFGPEKLPELARTLSKAMAEFQRATGGFRETLQQEMRQLEREIDERHSAVQSPPAPLPEPSVEPEAESHREEVDGAPPVSAAPVNPPESVENSASSAETPPENPANGHPTAA